MCTCFQPDTCFVFYSTFLNVRLMDQKATLGKEGREGSRQLGSGKPRFPPAFCPVGMRGDRWLLWGRNKVRNPEPLSAPIVAHPNSEKRGFDAPHFRFHSLRLSHSVTASPQSTAPTRAPHFTYLLGFLRQESSDAGVGRAALAFPLSAVVRNHCRIILHSPGQRG